MLAGCRVAAVVGCIGTLACVVPTFDVGVPRMLISIVPQADTSKKIDKKKMRGKGFMKGSEGASHLNQSTDS